MGTYAGPVHTKRYMARVSRVQPYLVPKEHFKLVLVSLLTTTLMAQCRMLSKEGHAIQCSLLAKVYSVR